MQSKLDADKDFILAPHMDQINRLFSGKTMEDIYRNLEEDGSEWALKQLETLKKMVSTCSVAAGMLKEMC